MRARPLPAAVEAGGHVVSATCAARRARAAWNPTNQEGAVRGRKYVVGSRDVQRGMEPSDET